MIYSWSISCNLYATDISTAIGLFKNDSNDIYTHNKKGKEIKVPLASDRHQLAPVLEPPVPTVNSSIAIELLAGDTVGS